MADLIPPPPEYAPGSFLAGEAEKRAGLKRMRIAATSLLGLAAVVFLFAHFQEGFYWGLLESVAEASMVGALADWFAVTAMFRRPLGLPIPHTAIIPHNKQRIGRSLGGFVQRHFLTPELIRAEVAKIDAAGYVADWLFNPENTARITQAVIDNAPLVIDRLNDERIRSFVHENITSRAAEADLGPLQRRIIAVVIREGNPERFGDLILAKASDFLEKNERSIIQAIESQVPYWARIIGLIELAMGRVRSVLAEVAADPRHPLRRQLVSAVIRALRAQQNSPEGSEWINDLKRRVLSHPETQTTIGDLWSRLLAALRADVSAEDSVIRSQIQRAATTLGTEMRRDRAFQDAVNGLFRDAVVTLAATQGPKFVQLVENRISAWSDADVIDRIEVNVGRDLQFIRINGTLVGGLVGGLLYLFVRLF